MNYIIVADKANHEEWLAARLTGVTATEVAKLATGGAAARAQILAEKLGKGSHFSGNRYTEHGNAREEFITDWIQATFGIAPSNKLIAAEDNPRFMATPDGLGTDEGAEGKTTSKPWVDRSDVPVIYTDQCQWGMRVSGLDRWLFAWEEHENFIPTHMEPKWFWIDRDDTRIAELETIAYEFLAEVDTPYQPTPYDELIATYLAQRAAVDEAQAELAETDARIRELLADKTNEKAVTPFGNLTWSTPKPRQTFDAKAFQASDPDTYNKFVKESQGKPALRITASKAEGQ